MPLACACLKVRVVDVVVREPPRRAESDPVVEAEQRGARHDAGAESNERPPDRSEAGSRRATTTTNADLVLDEDADAADEPGEEAACAASASRKAANPSRAAGTASKFVAANGAIQRRRARTSRRDTRRSPGVRPSLTLPTRNAHASERRADHESGAEPRAAAPAWSLSGSLSADARPGARRPRAPGALSRVVVARCRPRSRRRRRSTRSLLNAAPWIDRLAEAGPRRVLGIDGDRSGANARNGDRTPAAAPRDAASATARWRARPRQPP